MSSDRLRPGAAARARQRAGWPGRKATLQDEQDDGYVEASPGERVAMVQELTLAAWAMSGRPMPRYDRARMPGRLVRPGSSS